MIATLDRGGDTLEQGGIIDASGASTLPRLSKFAPTVGPGSPNDQAAGIDCRLIRLSWSARGWPLAFTRYSADYVTDKHELVRSGVGFRRTIAQPHYRATVLP